MLAHRATSVQNQLGQTNSAVASIVSRLRGRSVAEFRVRGLQAVQARIERLQGLIARGHSSERMVPVIEFRGDRSFASLLRFPAGVEVIARGVARRDPEALSKLHEQSDDLERGFVALLGHGLVSVGNPPRWHTEPLSGRQAPRRHWSRIDHLDTSVVGDHKPVWELNRHQYLLAPAFCWVLDRDQRWFDLIQLHLESWLADNPPRLGINWVSSLEVAYRAIAWCWLLWILRDAPWKADLRAKLTASLVAHALHVERYLSTYYSPNTHLTGEALGLFYVGTVLPDSRHAHRWRAKGSAILETWLDRQVHSDGVYFEQASQYHRYTTDIYLHYKLLADSTGWKVSDRVREVLGRLFDVLRSLVCGRGRIPLLGDDDGGLLLPLDHRPPDDVRALLLAGAVVLERPDLIFAVETPPTLAYWLCGIEETDRLIGMTGVNPGWRDMYFADGGVAILRDGWGPEDAVAVIDAGPHGALSCAHSHADAMALTLAIGSTELFVDRGTLTYTGPERNEFRSTASHNTLEIDRESSATPGRPFQWRNIPPPAHGAVYSTAEISGFAGIATGHAKKEGISTHRRWVLHQRRGSWVMLDRGARPGARGGTVRWQLSPGVQAERIGPRAVSIRSLTGAAVATVFAPLSSGLNLAIREVSLRLGHHVPAQVLEVEVDASLEALTIIVPASINGPPPAVQLSTDTGVPCCVWVDAEGGHRVVVSSPGGRRAEGAGVTVDADLSWWIDRSASQPAPGSASKLFAALGVRFLEVPGPQQSVTDPAVASGRMTVLAGVDGRWEAFAVDEPRRGKD